jgi:hypothetical protein
MATTLDANHSIQKLFNDFVNQLAADPKLPAFDYACVSSVESAFSQLTLEGDKIVVMQDSLERKSRFSILTYFLIPSFSTVQDLNSNLTMRVFARFQEMFPRYKTVLVYTADSLEAAGIDELVLTGNNLTVYSIEQDIMGRGQYTSNFNALKVKFIGYLDC